MKKHISVREEVNMSHSLFAWSRNENKQTLNTNKGLDLDHVDKKRH